jgi:tellurite resistance protein TehA-like permease
VDRARPLGQSITAANNLGTEAQLALPAPFSTAFRALGLVYGLPVWGFAMIWVAIAIAIAITITVRTARQSLPFSLTWWSFTFPVGTVVTGTSGLAAHTGSTFFTVASVVFFLGLVGAWATVAVRTAHDVFTGALLR